MKPLPDIATLATSMERWEWIAWIATLLVLVGVVGETIVEWFERPRDAAARRRLGRGSALILIFGLLGELWSQGKLSRLASEVTAILERETAEARKQTATLELEAAEQRERAAKAEAALGELRRGLEKTMAQAFKHEYRETLPTRRAELVANLKRMAIAKPGVEFVIDAHARTPDGNRDRVIADVAAIMREAGFAVRIAGPAIELGGPKLTPVAVRTPQAHRDLVIMLINGVFDPATRIVVSSQGAPEREIWMRISGVPAFLPDGRVRIEPES